VDRINQVKAAILGLIYSLPPLMHTVIFGIQEATGEIESGVIFTTLFILPYPSFSFLQTSEESP
jgi:hypothetical protein